MLLLTGALLGQAEPTPPDSILAIGLLVPPEPTEALSLRQGALLGIEQANRSPGSTARLVVRGRPGQWGTEGNEAAALALDDAVGGMITPTSGTAAHEVLQVAGRTSVPVVSLCPDSSITGAGVPWAVRIVPQNTEEASTVFTGLRPAEKTEFRWAALVPPDRAGREATHDLKAAASAAQCRLLEPISVASTNDLKALVHSLLTHRPQGVLLWTHPLLAGELTRALRQAGFSGVLAGPSRLGSDSFLRQAGKAAEGFVIPALTLSPDENPLNREFRREYQNRFSMPADPLALMAHDAVLVLVHILRQSGALPPHRLFPFHDTVAGASGLIRFDALGNRILSSSLQLQVCAGGQFVPLTPRTSPLAHRTSASTSP